MNMDVKRVDPSICLNMIVKNESEIIEKTLMNLCSKIKFDYWVICDTGSTDDTVERIKRFFDNKSINGELHVDEWVDFAHNRTLALERAHNKTDFLLIFDADDEIVGDIIFPDNMLKYDAYSLKLKSSNDIIFDRLLLVNNKKKWKFYGVIHEYITCLDDWCSTSLKGNYYIKAGTWGCRSKDTEKYKNDAITLENAYYEALDKNDKIHMRYSFYCANSYKDAKDIDNAIKWYKNTLTLDNWKQEKYVSCLRIYELNEQKKENNQSTINEQIYYLIESCKYDLTRVECICNLIKHYCITKNEKVAYSFYELIQKYYENDYLNDTFSNKLLVKESDYSFYLPYYMIIVCERLSKYDTGLKMYEIIFSKKNKNIGEWWIKHLVNNLQFFIEKNTDIHFVNNWRNYLTWIYEKNYNVDQNLINKYENYNISTFVETYSDSTDALCVQNRTTSDEMYVVLAILAKDKETTLPFYLNCIYNQTYDKRYIHLYVRTNDNKDNTAAILKEFIEQHRHEYASVYFDDSNISEELKKYSTHEWNSHRFSILGKIREDSIKYALNLKAHYFVADCDNFIVPETLKQIFKNKDAGVIAPMLKTGFNKAFYKDNIDNNSVSNNENYSNYHDEVTVNGYYKSNDRYYSILNRNITGLIRTSCVHCTYFIHNRILSSVNYNDETNRHEYVIFSETLRKRNIPQYIDNTQKYGYLTFLEKKEHVELEYNFNKNMYSFV